jgi:hypothetical protein
MTTTSSYYHILPVSLVALMLLVIPGLIWLEKVEPELWGNRLALPFLVPEPQRHTPLLTEGTFLPRQITRDTTFTVADSPLLLTGTTLIPVGVTVRIAPGVTIASHEFGELQVEGALYAEGTADRPLTFHTNEAHVENQVWSGISFLPGSRGSLRYANVSFAAPAVTCLTQETVALEQVHIIQTTLAFFTTSPRCTVTNSSLYSRRDGVHAVNTLPNLNNVDIVAKREKIKTY